MNALSEETRSQIRSTQILTTLAQIVSELVQNSLDAKSQHIEVGVNPDEWTCWVKDNGTGISRENMALIGRYATSKSYESYATGEGPTFGFRGEALASASDVSCIEISSRTASQRETWTSIIQGGQQLYAGPALTGKRSNSGTTILVREAFYNLPVRRRSHPSSTRTIEKIRRDIETFALVSPHVSFTLDKWTGDPNGSSGKIRLLTIPKSTSMLSVFHIIYGRALAEHVDEIDISRDGMRLQGFISMEGALNKAYQFLFINSRPSEPSDLHRAIGECFAASRFGIVSHSSVLPENTGGYE
ncbi:hypothetical protein FRC03_007474 [Tulasnella sp. 419]|nr:hypothetical protein FRC03_007474 [Tulasnella sp. 419]